MPIWYGHGHPNIHTCTRADTLNVCVRVLIAFICVFFTYKYQPNLHAVIGLVTGHRTLFYALRALIVRDGGGGAGGDWIENTSESNRTCCAWARNKVRVACTRSQSCSARETWPYSRTTNVWLNLTLLTRSVCAGCAIRRCHACRIRCECVCVLNSREIRKFMGFPFEYG